MFVPEPMKAARWNLVLVAWSEHAPTRADLEEIARLVAGIDPQIRAQVVSHHKLDQIRLLPLWRRPTLSVSFHAIEKRKLLPGRLATGLWLHKHGEYARLDAAGLPVPRWCVLTPETKLDARTWGPYVVVKPSAGRRGALVKIQKTTRVRYQPPETLPKEHFGRIAPMLVQEFIYTGEWPESYRVVTLFGTVLLCYRQVSRGRGHPLKARYDFKATGGISVVSNTREMEAVMSDEADVIALAELAHRKAFPDLPMLSFDIVRDAGSGALYILECHAQGSWMFTAEIGLDIEAANRLDFRTQFDALERTARILARETPLRAAVCSPFAAAPAPTSPAP